MVVTKKEINELYWAVQHLVWGDMNAHEHACVLAPYPKEREEIPNKVKAMIDRAAKEGVET